MTTTIPTDADIVDSPQMAGPRYTVERDATGAHGVCDHREDEFITSGWSYFEAATLRDDCNGRDLDGGRGNILEGRHVLPGDDLPAHHGVPREGDFILMPLCSDAPQGRDGWRCTQVTRVMVTHCSEGGRSDLFQLTTVAHGPGCWSWSPVHLIVD